MSWENHFDAGTNKVTKWTPRSAKQCHLVFFNSKMFFLYFVRSLTDCRLLLSVRRFPLYIFSLQSPTLSFAKTNMSGATWVRRFRFLFFSLQSEKKPHFSLSFAFSEYELRTLLLLAKQHLSYCSSSSNSARQQFWVGHESLLSSRIYSVCGPVTVLNSFITNGRYKNL